MKNIVLVIFLLSFFSALIAAKASCATMYLKAGSEVKGTIVEETDEYIKINFYGVPLKYERNEIERIENAHRPINDVTDDYSKNGADLIVNGLYEDAINTLTAGLKRDPTDAACYNNLAVANACAGNYQGALGALRKALELETGDYATIINYNLAEVYCRLNLIPEAKAITRKIACENLRNLLERTISLKMSGINADSIIMASSFPPDTVFVAPQPLAEARDALAAPLHQSDSSNDKAYIVENFPLLFLYKSPLSYLNLSFAAITEGQFPDAKKYLDAAQEAIGEKKEYSDKLALAGVYFARGEIALEEHDYYLARKNFKKTIELFSRWPIFHKYLGTTYYLLRRYPQAQEEFQTAILLIGHAAPEAGEIEEYLRKIKNMHYSQ